MSPLVRRIGLWALALSTLAAIFLAYLKPDVALMLAQQLWNCF
jgi:hypothetical protein